MIVEFEVDRIRVDVRGGFATVECHRYDRWHRISGPFREMKGDVLEEAPRGRSLHRHRHQQGGDGEGGRRGWWQVDDLVRRPSGDHGGVVGGVADSHPSPGRGGGTPPPPLFYEAARTGCFPRGGGGDRWSTKTENSGQEV